MTGVDVLPAKQQHLIGVGASVVAGCQPCTLTFAAAARQAGACERGVRFAVESGLGARERATAGMSAFAATKLAQPELDAAFRGERKLLDALIAVAGAVAGNAAWAVRSAVDAARTLGATDAQILGAAEIARRARRRAEREADSTLAAALGLAAEPAGAETSAEGTGCGCGCG
jgi:AhpD family alkylhydroperoxidase